MSNASDFDVAGKNPLPTNTDVNAQAQAEAQAANADVPTLAITADELADIVAALFTLGTDPSFAGKPEADRLKTLGLKLTLAGMRV